MLGLPQRQPRNYKDWVGPEQRYESDGQQRFELLLCHGLREEHRVLDIGCGSLRLGRLLIPFLLPGRYHGVDPGEHWVREGLREEVARVYGAALLQHKRPVFEHRADFDFSGLGTSFDFLVAFSVFIHCGRAQLERCLDRAREVMHASSTLLLDLNIADRTEERGAHRKYPWASHQTTRYAMADAGEILARAGFGWELLEARPSARKQKARTLFKLRRP